MAPVGCELLFVMLSIVLVHKVIIVLLADGVFAFEFNNKLIVHTRRICLLLHAPGALFE